MSMVDPNNKPAVPQDDGGTEDLLKDSDTVQDLALKATETKPVTEVTSLAKEEEKTGLRQEIPTAEELTARATSSYIRHLRQLNDLISGRNGGSYKISRKGMNRIMNSILQLPQDGLPVLLQGNEEKMAFAVGQRIIADRFLITQHHISQEIKRMREKQELKNSEKVTETKVEGETNEQV